MKRACLLALLFLAPSQALAWENPAQIVHGTSRLLEKGETVIGVLSPMAFGLHERVTVFLHPALYLFLTPNVWFRAGVLQGEPGVSLEAGYQQSFLAIQQSDGGESSDYPGMVQLGAVTSLSFSQRWQGTVALGYLAELSQGERGTVNGVYGRIGADFLITPENLIMAEFKARYLFPEGFAIPTFTAIYARQFGRMRLGAGLVVGQFSFSTASTGLEADSPSEVTLPVYPWLDAWWRF